MEAAEIYEEIAYWDEFGDDCIISPECTGYFTDKADVLQDQDDSEHIIQAKFDSDHYGNRVTRRQTLIFKAKQYLAICYRKLGNYSQAISHLEQLLREQVKCGLTDWDPDFVFTKHILASCLLATGRVCESLSLFKEVLKFRRNVLGSHHPETLRAQVNYITCLNECADVDANEVLREYEDVLRKQTEVLGDGNPVTLQVFINYSHALMKYGRHKEALKHVRLVLELRRKMFGERHPETLKALNTVAICTKSLGDFDEALKLFRVVLDKRLSVFQNKFHPSILDVRQNIATCLIDKNKPKEAIDILIKIREQQNDVIGPTHPNTLSVEYNISVCLRRLGEYDQAIELIHELLDKEKNVLGENHVDTIATEHSLAVCLHCKGDRRAAWEIYERVLKWRRDNLGENHCDTENTKRNMMICRREDNAEQPYLKERKQIIRRHYGNPSETLTRKYFFKRCCCINRNSVVEVP